MMKLLRNWVPVTLFLTSCAVSPSDFTGKPLDDAISEYGSPVAAVDFEGARQFIFEPGHPAKDEDETFLNPDKQIPMTSFKSEKCLYVMNALYTGAYKEWRIHSVTLTPNCKGNQ